jgi:hypothetical protein
MNDRRILAAAVTSALLLAALPAVADTAKEQQLEARVAELEKLVKQLVAAQPAAAPAAGAAPSTTALAATAAAAAPAKPAPPPVQAVSIVPNADANTRFLFTGYAKVDGLFTRTPDGYMGDAATGRDFYVPAQTPVGGDYDGTDFTAHAKQTRLILGTDTSLAGGKTLSTRFEMDFFGSALGNQRSTNTYGMVLRQAYVQWGNWLVGQTWSTFQDTNALVDSLDFIGATDGTVFVRQPQFRYTRGGLALALENPETTYVPFGTCTPATATALCMPTQSDRGDIPDIIGKYTFKGDWGSVSLAAMFRELSYQPLNDRRVSEATFSGAISGKLMVFGQDDIRFELVGGNIGRYVALNYAADAVLTTSVAGTTDLEALDGYAGLVAYRHVWSPKLRSSLYYAMQSYDNDFDLTGGKVGKESYSITGNIIYSPLPKLEIGAEYRHASNEREDGADGTLDRIQVSTKYSF